MRIDRGLNFLIPVTRSDGAEIYVHAMPISAEVFDSHFLVLSKTFAEIYGQGLGMLAGPRVADKVLRKVALDLGVWDDAPDAVAGAPHTGVRYTLVAEMHRLTQVIASGDNGWETYPYDLARSRGILEPDDASEVDGALTFFIVASAMHRRAELRAILEGAGNLWGARVTSSNCMDFVRSLRMSTETANSGATNTAA